MNPDEFETRLMSLDPEAIEFPLLIDDLLMQVPISSQVELIPAILKYVEKNPLFDNGMPGTMVHFIEDFYPTYKPLLLRSLATQPSKMCVLMVNRILNSKLDEIERSEYVDALRSVACNSGALEEVRIDARHFIDYQQGRQCSIGGKA